MLFNFEAAGIFLPLAGAENGLSPLSGGAHPYAAEILLMLPYDEYLALKLGLLENADCHQL